jgi:hypothetical protein
VACFRPISIGSDPSVNRLVNAAASVSSVSAHSRMVGCPKIPSCSSSVHSANDVRLGRRASLSHFPLLDQCRVDLSSPIQIVPRAIGKDGSPNLGLSKSSIVSHWERTGVLRVELRFLKFRLS